MYEQQEDLFNPNKLLDKLHEIMCLKNDAALSRRLCVAPSIISNIRRGRIPVGASILVRIHEATNLSIKDLRAIMGDRRATFRMSFELYNKRKSAQRRTVELQNQIN